MLGAVGQDISAVRVLIQHVGNSNYRINDSGTHAIVFGGDPKHLINIGIDMLKREGTLSLLVGVGAWFTRNTVDGDVGLVL